MTQKTNPNPQKTKSDSSPTGTTKILILSCAVVVTLALLLICRNTLRVNQKISECNIELIPLNSALANIDSVFKYHADTTQELLLLKVDAHDFQQHILKLHEAVNQLKEQKRWLLDANAISFLFQILSVLLIAIGLYLLQEINRLVGSNKKASEHITRKIRKQKRYSEQTATELSQKMQHLDTRSGELDLNIKARQVFNQLFSCCQIIHQYAVLLKEETPNTEKYNAENLKLCFQMNKNCMAIQEQLERLHNELLPISFSDEDTNLLQGLLKEARNRFHTEKLIDAGKYYTDVFENITKTSKTITIVRHQ